MQFCPPLHLIFTDPGSAASCYIAQMSGVFAGFKGFVVVVVSHVFISVGVFGVCVEQV